MNTKINYAGENSFNKSNAFIYRRGLDEKVVRKELFLLEGEEGFEESVLRSKMTRVIKRSSEELQNLYYDLGIENALPGNWNDFKQFIVTFCVEEGLYAKRKYVDETWSSYLKRLYDWSKMHNISNDELLRKLKRENLPEQMRVICYVPNITVEAVIKSLHDFEDGIRNGIYMRKRNEKPNKNAFGIKEIKNASFVERKDI
jgi:hypothetical protein